MIRSHPTTQRSFKSAYRRRKSSHVTIRPRRSRRHLLPSMISRLFRPFAWPLVTRFTPPPVLLKASLRMGLPLITAASRGGTFSMHAARNGHKRKNESPRARGNYSMRIAFAYVPSSHILRLLSRPLFHVRHTEHRIISEFSSRSSTFRDTHFRLRSIGIREAKCQNLRFIISRTSICLLFSQVAQLRKICMTDATLVSAQQLNLRRDNGFRCDPPVGEECPEEIWS